MRPLMLLLPLAVALASCGEKTALTLPADPVDRAATCGVVAAASAREASASVEAPLTFEEQQRIVHYAMLAGAESESFAQDRAAAVAERMSTIESGITGGEWSVLVEPCRAAFPAARPTDAIALPDDPLESQFGCFMLADFLTTALRSQEADYGAELRGYEAMQRSLDARLGRTLAARGAMSMAQTQEARAQALATMVKLGPPDQVMQVCLERYS